MRRASLGPGWTQDRTEVVPNRRGSHARHHHRSHPAHGPSLLMARHHPADVEDPDRRTLDPPGPARHTGGMGFRVSCPDFVGRADELDVLTAVLDGVAGGQAATVVIGGEAGIGKTRLLDEFCERAVGSHLLVARGCCVPIEGGGLPYGPVLGIVRDLVGQVGESAAAGLLDSLASGLGLGVRARRDRTDIYSAVRPLSDELAKTRLFESVLACFAGLAEQSTVILVFEDLQWADSATADLLGFLTRNLGDVPVLLLCSYRSEELGRDHQLRPWLSELGRHGRVTQLLLGGLDRDEVASMIGGILGHEPEWALADAVWARSQGNPFFAEELTAARHDSTLSAEFQGVIMARIEGLADESQQVLRAVAAAGANADHRLLVVTGGLDADALDRALGESIDKQILVVDADRTGYRFRHALLREAVDLAMLPGERARLHRQVADAFVADPSLGPTEPGHRAAELAAHWWAAGAWSEALAASMAAAEAAVAIWAFPEALAHLESALAALERLPDGQVRTPADRLRLLEQAADVAYLASAGRRSVDLAEAAILQVDAATDQAWVARLYSLLGRNTWAIGDSQAAFEAYRQAADRLSTDEPSVALARVLAEEARGLMMMSRSSEAEGRCIEAIAAARAVGARAEEGHALNTLGCCRGALGHLDEAVELVEEALLIAEEVGNPEDLNRAFGNLTGCLLDAGRLEEAAALVFDNAAVGEQLWGVRLESAAANASEALTLMGRYDEAEALLAQVGNRGLGACAASPDMARAPIEIRRGRFDEAARVLVTVDELTAGLSDVQQRGTYHMLSAELALEEGRPGDAYASIEQALALAAGTDDEAYLPEMCALGVRALADQSQDARHHGGRFDFDKARLLARNLEHEAEEIVAATVARGGRCRPRTVAFAAMCAAERARIDRSDPHTWAEAAGRWDAVSEPCPASYCRWREAEALLEARTGRDRAAERLQEAWRVTTDLGLEPLRARIERLAQRARIPLVESGTTEMSEVSVGRDLGLTPRELEVLGQLAVGRRDAEIAESLFISKKTASVHVSNILRKLDVPNRVEAGRIGQAHGLGDLAPAGSPSRV